MTERFLLQAIAKSARAFLNMAPMLLGVILCMGLFQTFVTDAMLRALFSGNPLADMLIGTAAGGLSIGQPVASYIIGGELLENGISRYAITAFIVAWVTIGLLQLPFERSVFGGRFTLIRNLLNLLFALVVAAATAGSMELLL